MKQQHKTPATTLLCAICATLPLFPWVTFASPEAAGTAAAIPVHMNMPSFLIIGALLLVTTTMFFAFKARFNSTNQELKDITSELSQTRQHLTESNRKLEKTGADLKNTTNRYQGILFDAQVGMFQMDLNGKCTYINTAMKEISGLYPKKALKEGLQSALHPDDRKTFQEAWTAFTGKNKPFQLRCRFKHAKGREVHVVCKVNKVLNERKDAESYIGWVSDVTALHEEGLQQEAHTARYARFIDETIEGYFQLVPENPIPLTDSAAQMAKAIMGKMTLSSCNETFASMYGTSPSKLKGKTIDALPSGCGPFKDLDSIKNFVTTEYKAIDLESVRQDPRGNHLILLNNVVGLIEGNKLVGIWGSQRNISQQKREKAELTSQAQFMRRILDALPADVHVKDTRCRYLYASQKLANRTGIPPEDWLGKTIFEVMPSTARDHDKNMIEVMKKKTMARTERPFEARGKSGWMETIQIPLVSGEGLVEGVVGLSLDVSERKQKEEEARHLRQQLDQQLKTRTAELSKSQDEHGKTSIALRDTTQKLRIREAELENHATGFKQQLSERKRAEELLRRNEETLLTRQKQLEQQLSNRLDQLDQETDKRKKWEELIAIKEDELRKIEKHTHARQKQLKEEIALREKTQANLATSQSGLEKIRKELELVAKEHQQGTTTLTDSHRKEFKTEHDARQQAEGQLKKTDALLKKTQEHLKELAKQHAAELEHETSERKTATTKLSQSSEELDELKQRFNLRIEEETKALKNELAQRQIREKALRQHEKEMDGRINDLEKTLHQKMEEHHKQTQAREKAEVERQKTEGKLEQLTGRQKALVERETQKLHLDIAEIRLQEVKLRKAVGDLQQAKKDLETLVETRTAELETAKQEQQKLGAALSGTQAQLKQISNEQSALVAKETATLQEELKQLKQTEHDLRKQEEQLKTQSGKLEDTIQELSAKLKNETTQREETAKKLDDLQSAFDANQDNAGTLLKQHTRELTEQIEQQKRNEAELQKNETTLKNQAETLRKTIDTRTGELAEARKEREKAEAELVQTIARSGQSAKEIEVQITKIKQGHQDEIERIKDEQKEVRQKETYYRSLVQFSANAFLQIDPLSGKILSANLAAANLFGEETAKPLVGKTLDALSPKQQPDGASSADLAKTRLRSTLETGHASVEWQFQKAEDATFHGITSLSTIDIDGKQLILAVIQDISNIKQKQAELQKSVEEAHAANQMNIKIVDEVNEVVQSSLDPVVESSTAIEKADNLSAEQKLGMAEINHSCRSLIDIMNYRRELSHVTDGSGETEASHCDLHGLIKDLDEQFCKRAETKNLFFAVSYAQHKAANHVPKLVKTDESKVRKILEILLGYALENTSKGRIGLHATRKSSEGEMATVGFELAYTGTQKEDELLSRVFVADDGETGGPEAMKYVLTLVHRYVRMLGGEISLDYRQGGITALAIDLPFKTVESEIALPGKDNERILGAA